MSCRGLNRVVKEEEEDGKDSGLDFGEGMGSCFWRWKRCTALNKLLDNKKVLIDRRRERIGNRNDTAEIAGHKLSTQFRAFEDVY